MDERSRSLLDDATAGLKDDPELRLDVRAELASHLDAAAATYEAEGHDPAESAELAAHDFGSPVEVAGELLAANAGRMKWRARARLVLRAVVVPVAVVLAVWMVLDTMNLLYGYRLQVVPGTNPHFRLVPNLLCSADDRAKLREAEFLLHGDLTRTTRAGRLRAIWERYPDNRAHFARYIMQIANEDVASDAELHALMQELALGRQLDPDNGLYDYIAAKTWSSFLIPFEPMPWKKERSSTYRPRMTDDAIRARTFAALRAGAAKPWCTTHDGERRRNILAQMPRSASAFDRSTELPTLDDPTLELSLLMSPLIRAIPDHAPHLAASGHRAEALALLDLWQPITRQRLRSAETYTGCMMATSSVVYAKRFFVPVYRELGEARRAKTVFDRTDAMLNAFQASNPTHTQRVRDAEMERAGLLGQIVLGIYPGYFQIDELTPERKFWQFRVEKVTACLLVIAMLALLARAWLLSLRHFLGLRQANAVPLLLLPSWGVTIKVVALTIVLPIALYVLYSQYSGLAGREYGGIMHWLRMSIELLTLLIVLLIWPARMLSQHITRRCRQLGVAVPDTKAARRAGAVAFFGAIGWLSLIAIVCAAWFNNDDPSDIFTKLRPALLIFLVLVSAGIVLSGRRSAHSFSLFYGTLTRSLLPGYACAVLLIGLCWYPYLQYQETYWLRQDRLIFIQPDSDEVYRPIELRVMKAVRQKVEGAFDSLP